MNRALALLVVLAACEGGKGNGPADSMPRPGDGNGALPVEENRTIASLSSGERSELCEYFVDVLGPTRTITCGDGTMTTRNAAEASECISAFQDIATNAPSCPITVGQYDACIAAIAALTDQEICDGSAFPAACAPLENASCSGSGSGGGQKRLF